MTIHGSRRTRTGRLAATQDECRTALLQGKQDLLRERPGRATFTASDLIAAARRHLCVRESYLRAYFNALNKSEKARLCSGSPS